MKKIKFLAMLFMALIVSAGFSACGDDDENDTNGSGGNITASSLIGRSFVRETSNVDDDGYPEYDKITITFTSTTQCSVKSNGYSYVWYYEGYKKESYNETRSCQYSVSGDKITLHSYPFYAFDGDLVLTYKGSYLDDKYDIYYEK